MLFLYENFQKILLLLLNFISIIFKNEKIKRFVYLRNPKQFYATIIETKKIYSKISLNENIPIYWFHVSSAGEIEQAIPIAKKLSENLNAKFFLTYYSPSAEPFIKNFPALIGHAGLPIDVRNIYNKLLDSIPIQKIFFVRYDIWPSLFFFCKKNNIEINLLSATAIKTKQGIHALVSNIWTKLFYKNFSNVFAVSKNDVTFFCNYLPNENVHFAGDAKWARAYERTQNKRNNEDNFQLFYDHFMNYYKNNGKKVVVFGSPHIAEQTVAIQCEKLKLKLFNIYVPHDASVKNCNKLLVEFKQNGLNFALYSSFLKDLSSSNFNKEFIYDGIIIDKIGVLAELYGLADVAIVGGGFDGQVHNVLEASAHGTPVLIGNLYSRAYEVKEIVDAGAAIPFQTANEMFQFLSLWVNLGEANEGTESPFARLAHAKARSIELFQSIPNTSEIILQALLKNKDREI